MLNDSIPYNHDTPKTMDTNQISSPSRDQQIAYHEQIQYHNYLSLMQGQDKWPYKVENAFTSALRLIMKSGTSKIKVRNKNYGRNELISLYIKYQTGEIRTKKQISSHIQVWKKSILNKMSSNMHLTALDTEMLSLIENGAGQNEQNSKLFYSVFEEIIDALAKRESMNLLHQANYNSQYPQNINGLVPNVQVYVNPYQFQQQQQVILTNPNPGMLQQQYPSNIHPQNWGFNAQNDYGNHYHSDLQTSNSTSMPQQPQQQWRRTNQNENQQTQHHLIFGHVEGNEHPVLPPADRLKLPQGSPPTHFQHITELKSSVLTPRADLLHSQNQNASPINNILRPDHIMSPKPVFPQSSITPIQQLPPAYHNTQPQPPNLNGSLLYMHKNPQMQDQHQPAALLPYQQYFSNQVSASPYQTSQSKPSFSPGIGQLQGPQQSLVQQQERLSQSQLQQQQLHSFNHIPPIHRSPQNE
ncbi:hypothetical protein KAFR_0H01220 [Kazachstania africana CBS 2517]|uniref:TEA domain-containing protein n=1 Tax=Kazachstania africana (strain ATCC 22294 / BCRC 22015 / CBS 2517 / CECT 1963 / NBRC 1671 / NRRL Y-8276) TaxID=1071382 RepID=H2AYX6_KAZAF|nr:hypothetical protein KAFR_0H01220 [Kazachstania africana CBS 2517]CCF59532.1 hypothetical protein KAFR_0H01220 [Kazachstania africana CBS 2517]